MARRLAITFIGLCLASVACGREGQLVREEPSENGALRVVARPSYGWRGAENDPYHAAFLSVCKGDQIVALEVDTRGLEPEVEYRWTIAGLDGGVLDNRPPEQIRAIKSFEVIVGKGSSQKLVPVNGKLLVRFTFRRPLGPPPEPTSATLFKGNEFILGTPHATVDDIATRIPGGPGYRRCSHISPREVPLA